MAERIHNKTTQEVTLSGEVSVVWTDAEITRAFDEVVGNSPEGEGKLYELIAKRFDQNPAMVLAKISAASEALKLGVGEVTYLPEELEDTEATVGSPVVR